MTLADEFLRTKERRIVYKGQEVWREHWFPIADKQRVRVTIESYDSDWGGLGQYRFFEGVGLMIDKQIRVNDVSSGFLALWPYSPPWEQLQPPYYEVHEIEMGWYYFVGPRKWISLWCREPYKPIELFCRTRDGHIHVWNVWNDGNVRHGIDGLRNCAGMIVEEIENGFRYRCNDGYPDEDFNDIVFRIERCEE